MKTSHRRLFAVVTICAAAAVGMSFLWTRAEKKAGNRLSVMIIDGDRDIGVVRTGVKRESIFVFRNLSLGPLATLDVRSDCSCGAVDSKYSKDPVDAGQEGRIVCKYPLQPGRHDMKLYVTFSNGEVHALRIQYRGLEHFALSTGRTTWDPITEGTPSEERMVVVYGDEDYSTERLDFVIGKDRPKWLNVNVDVEGGRSQNAIRGSSKTALAKLVLSIAPEAPAGTFCKSLSVFIKVRGEEHKVQIEVAGTVVAKNELAAHGVPGG